MSKLINIAFFILTWCLCVLFGNGGAVVALILLCCYLFSKIDKPIELKIVFYLGMMGVVLAQVLGFLDVYRFYGRSHLIAFWLIVLWFCFATTINCALHFLQKRPLIFSAILGAICAPAIYIAMEALNPQLLSYPKGAKETGVILFVVWFFWLPLLMTVARKMIRQHHRDQEK